MSLADRTYAKKNTPKKPRYIPPWKKEKYEPEKTPGLVRYEKELYRYRKKLLHWRHGDRSEPRPVHPFLISGQVTVDERKELNRRIKEARKQRREIKNYANSQPKLF